MACFISCLGSLLLLVLIYKAFDWLLRRFYIGRYSERYIFMTGCDSGFGQAAARRLDALGCHVFAGCLTEAGETELSKSCSSRMQPVSLDVSKPDSVRRAFDIVKTKLPPGKGLWGVLNNAGACGGVGPPEWQTIDDYKAVAAVNLYGLIDVTMTFLPLVKMARGRVVNTASVVGRVCVSYNIPYCVTKYGVEAFSDGLRRSLHPFKVKVSLIEPGRFPTPLNLASHVLPYWERAWGNASPEVKAEYGEDYYKACTSFKESFYDKIGSYGQISEVVDAYVHALLSRYPRARYVLGPDSKYFWLPVQALPEWIGDWVLRITDPRPLPASATRRK